MDRDKYQRARDLFASHGGIMSTGEAIDSGIHRRTLYTMRDNGDIERLERGLYRLADLPPLSNPDLVPVALKIPKGVVCLISALAYYELTTQVPHKIYIALPRNTEPPRFTQPPIQIFWFKGKAYSEGIEEHRIDGVPVKIYCIEKTIADCFKYRNKLGLDVALEALKEYWKKGKRNIDTLVHYAKVCRMDKVMKPYLEAMT
jgi:predicted transcriptional regulator of viral defense system